MAAARISSAYLKRLAEKTEYHDYTIDELTQYLPKEKKLYSVSDIYNAYNRYAAVQQGVREAGNVAGGQCRCHELR